MTRKKRVRPALAAAARLPAAATRQFGIVPDGRIAEEFGVPVEAVRYARCARGIVGRRGSPRVAWTPARDALLGTMSDARLARKLGVTPNTIFQRRSVLGIAPFGKTRAEAQKKWTPAILQRLGKLPDAELAERLGVSVSTVVERRKILGIASPTGRRGRPPRVWTKEQIALLGKLTDTEVARRLHIGRRHVQAKRRALGLVAAFEKKHRKRWTPARLAKLGKVTDRALAAEIGVTPSSVAVQRRQRNIPAYTSSGSRQRQRRTRQPWTPARVKRLGKEVDQVLADEMGITRAAVAAFRARLGIAAFRG